MAQFPAHRAKPNHAEVRRRYIFNAGTAQFSIAGRPVFRQELWVGVEIECGSLVDVERFSREHGYDLVPAEGFTADELSSVGVDAFPALRISGLT